jgi:hypothetical protein
MDMRLYNAKAELSPFHMTITWNESTGEYRVNFQHGQECTAYYTDDLEDAIDTGKAMRRSSMAFVEDQNVLVGQAPPA